MIHFTITVANTAEKLAAEAYGPGALLRWESSATQTGVFVEGDTIPLISGTSLYDVWDAAGVDGVTWYRSRLSTSGWPGDGSAPSAYSTAVIPVAPWPSLTVDQFRTFATSALPDEALLTLLSAAAAAIAEVAGATGEITEYDTGGYTRIVVGQLIGTLASVTEDDVLLAADDYRASGYVLTRLDTGGNPSTTWGTAAVVVYTPADDTAERQRVQLELVKLDLAYQPGLTGQTIGTFSETYSSTSVMNYEIERSLILASLGGSGGGMRVVD